MSSSRVVSFDFQVIIESGEGVVERDAGHLPARESQRRHGEADDAARGGGGLTTIRSASTKASLVHLHLDRLRQGGFMLEARAHARRSSRKLFARLFALYGASVCRELGDIEATAIFLLPSASGL